MSHDFTKHHARQLKNPGDDYAVGSHEVFREEHDSYDKRDVTILRTRRVVNPTRGEELQIDITTRRHHKKSGRVTESFGSLCLTPEQADALALSCAHIRGNEPQDGWYTTKFVPELSQWHVLYDGKLAVATFKKYTDAAADRDERNKAVMKRKTA